MSILTKSIWPCIYHDSTFHFKVFKLLLFYMRHEHITFILKKQIWNKIWNDYCSLSLAILKSYCHPKMKIFKKSEKFFLIIFFLKRNSRNLNFRNFASLDTCKSLPAVVSAFKVDNNDRIQYFMAIAICHDPMLKSLHLINSFT